MMVEIGRASNISTSAASALLGAWRVAFLGLRRVSSEGADCGVNAGAAWKAAVCPTQLISA